VPQAAGAAKRVWGFGHGTELLAIYPARTEMQLRRSGTNVAKWGFHVLSHQEFQGLKTGNGGTRDNFCAISFMTSFCPHHKGS